MSLFLNIDDWILNYIILILLFIFNLLTKNKNINHKYLTKRQVYYILCLKSITYGGKVMEFNERLANLLSESGMSQRELAKEINIDEAALSKYVSGVRKPRMDILVNIARVLSVSVEYLATGSDRNEDFNTVKNLVCRNISTMTDAQKIELMEVIFKKETK